MKYFSILLYNDNKDSDSDNCWPGQQQQVIIPSPSFSSTKKKKKKAKNLSWWALHISKPHQLLCNTAALFLWPTLLTVRSDRTPQSIWKHCSDKMYNKTITRLKFLDFLADSENYRKKNSIFIASIAKYSTLQKYFITN